MFHSETIIQNCPINPVSYASYSSRLLLLASDVELNPGPVEDIEQILKAIRDGNDRTAVQLQDLKTDMQVIKSDMVSMKGDIGTIKFKVQNVESKQSRIDNDLKKIESKIDMLDHRTETLESDMSALSMNDESRENIIYELTKQVNILEKENKKCNLRIFGLAWIQMRTMIC